MTYRWFADAKSLDFLDLCACEFHEKSNAELISALDLCITSRRYFYLPFLRNREDLMDHFRVMDVVSENIPFFRGIDVGVPSNIKLIEVLILTEQEDLTACYFSDYTRNMIKSFSAGWEKEKIRVFLKHVKMYVQCIEKSLFPITVFSNPEPNIITFEKPVVTYNRREKSLFLRTAMKQLANEIIKFLFDNDCTDSLLIAEVFDAVCFFWMNEFFFKYEANRMEYIFRHLRKANCCYFARVLEILQNERHYSVFLRSSPDHLLVFLNYGINIKYKPILRPYGFYQFNSTEQPEINWGRIPTFLQRQWMNLNRREAFIVEIFTNMSAWSVSHFAVYLESLCLIWRSVPYPFLSYDEMRRFLLRHTDSKSVEDICNELQNRECDSFEMIHQPRTLSHYCRCVLRDALMSNSQLPDGIGLLRLPKRLQSYLRLEF